LIDDLTKYFKRIKELEQQLKSTRSELEETIYICESKTKVILNLKSEIRDLTNKLKKPLSVDTSDMRTYIDEEEEINLADVEPEEGEISEPVEKPSTKKSKVIEPQIEDKEDTEIDDKETESGSESNDEVSAMDVEVNKTHTDATKTEISEMEIDKTSTTDTFNKSVEMNPKKIDIKSEADDFIALSENEDTPDEFPLEEDEIEYLLGLESEIKVEPKDDGEDQKKITKKRKT
jgi:hypothetical protein